MEVKNAFRDLKETVYMRPPPRSKFEHLDLVWHLRRSLYSLKQAPLVWFEKDRYVILKANFKYSKYDHLMFTQCTPSGIIILVYVDGILLCGDNSPGIRNLKTSFNASFHMKILVT